MLIQNELRKHPIDRILIAKARQRPSIGGVSVLAYIYSGIHKKQEGK